MHQMKLSRVFNNYELTYMQGIVAGVQKKYLWEQTDNNLTRVRMRLKQILDFEEEDKLPMPIVMVILGPFFDIQVFSGKEALPFLRPYFAIAGIKTPPDEFLERTAQGIVDIANFKTPDVKEFREKYKYWNNAPTEVFRSNFLLQKAQKVFQFPVFQFINDEAIEDAPDVP
jgi:hypothetical protein